MNFKQSNFKVRPSVCPFVVHLPNLFNKQSIHPANEVQILPFPHPIASATWNSGIWRRRNEQKQVQSEENVWYFFRRIPGNTTKTECKNKRRPSVRWYARLTVRPSVRPYKCCLRSVGTLTSWIEPSIQVESGLLPSVRCLTWNELLKLITLGINWRQTHCIVHFNVTKL